MSLLFAMPPKREWDRTAAETWTVPSIVSTKDCKELGRRAYPDPNSAVRRILDALPDELPVAEYNATLRALLAVT